MPQEVSAHNDNTPAKGWGMVGRGKEAGTVIYVQKIKARVKQPQKIYLADIQKPFDALILLLGVAAPIFFWNEANRKQEKTRNYNCVLLRAGGGIDSPDFKIRRGLPSALPQTSSCALNAISALTCCTSLRR